MPQERTPINISEISQNLGLFLNFSRAISAYLVLIYHASGQKYSGAFAYQLSIFGPRAVDVFFVLSGFLIYFSAQKPGTTLRQFAIARLSRVYSVALPALIIVVLVDVILTSNPTWNSTFTAAEIGTVSVRLFVLNLLFINNIWHMYDVFGSNGAYWSLSYEVWYYILFAFLFFLRGSRRILCTAMGLLIVGPNIAGFFPLWLIGVATYKVKLRAISRSLSWVIGTVSLVLMIISVTLGAHYSVDAFVAVDLTTRRLLSMTINYGTGLAFGGMLVAVHAFTIQLPDASQRLQKIAQFFAGFSFTLYLVHYPLLKAFVVISPWPLDSWPHRSGIYLGIPCVAWLLSFVTEQRRNSCIRLFDSILPGRPATPKPHPSP